MSLNPVLGWLVGQLKTYSMFISLSNNILFCKHDVFEGWSAHLASGWGSKEIVPSFSPIVGSTCSDWHNRAG